ncbi:hypothetical protein R1A27_32975 (plasmid) [Methylobacterium sp. NMS12]|uniref:hypothetical protein n=1 Tax=Methylobacterium sp. NMS12 TaxID=3079766 RepID=UPI003F8821BE
MKSDVRARYGRQTSAWPASAGNIPAVPPDRRRSPYGNGRTTARPVPPTPLADVRIGPDADGGADVMDALPDIIPELLDVGFDEADGDLEPIPG